MYSDPENEDDHVEHIDKHKSLPTWGCGEVARIRVSGLHEEGDVLVFDVVNAA